MIVERYGCFGGNLTHVGVEGIAWYRQSGTVDVEGIGIEFEERAKRFGSSGPEPQSLSHAINGEMFKVVADNWIIESGIRPLLHSLAVDVIRDGRSLRGIIVQNKSGRQAILAKRIIDATGDADIAHLARVPIKKTPKEEMLSVTVMFSCRRSKQGTLSPVRQGESSDLQGLGEELGDENRRQGGRSFQSISRTAFRSGAVTGVIPSGLKSIGGTWSLINDRGEATYLNMVHMLQYDGTDVDDLTSGEIEGRRQALLAIKALQHFAPGFETATLRNFGMTIGIRDTRKIIGRYCLTEQDVRGQARFDDAIGIFPEFIDGYGILVLPTTGRYYHVPYGALVASGVDNLLVAGRWSPAIRFRMPRFAT